MDGWLLRSYVFVLCLAADFVWEMYSTREAKGVSYLRRPMMITGMCLGFDTG